MFIAAIPQLPELTWAAIMILNRPGAMQRRRVAGNQEFQLI